MHTSNHHPNHPPKPQTGFVIGFRVNNAYQLYYEGRRIVGQIINAIREVVLEAYTSLPKGAIEGRVDVRSGRNDCCELTRFSPHHHEPTTGTPGPSFPDDGGVVPGGPANVNYELYVESRTFVLLYLSYLIYIHMSMSIS